MTLRALAASRPLWFALITAAALLVLEFGFFLVTPRLLLDRPFAWRHLVPGAAVCTVAGAIVHTVAVFFLRNWFGQYGNAYGAFGVGLALIAALGIIASFWVWIAAVMGVVGASSLAAAKPRLLPLVSTHLIVSGDRRVVTVSSQPTKTQHVRRVPEAQGLIRQEGSRQDARARSGRPLGTSPGLRGSELPRVRISCVPYDAQPGR